jgi:thioredoxin 1
MEIIHASSDNFDEVVSKGLVLIDFYADWCGPCRALAPVLEELASDRSELKIVKINVDKDPVLAQKYDVMSIPNLVLLKDAKVLGSRVGLFLKKA